MKKTFLLLCYMGFFLAGKAQLSFSLGYAGWKPHSPTFDNFIVSYNTVEAPYLKSPLQRLGATNAVRLDAGFGFLIYDIRFGYMPFSSTVRANFLNGESRTFKLNGSMTDISFGFRLPAEKWSLGLYIGAAMNTRNTRLYSYYTYLDGTESYTAEKYISNAYRSNFITIFSGLRGTVGLKNFKVFGSAEYIGLFEGKEGAVDAEDDLNRWSTTGNHLMTQYLVEDYSRSGDDIVANSGIADNVDKTFRGWRFTLGVEVDLLRKNYKVPEDLNK